MKINIDVNKPIMKLQLGDVIVTASNNMFMLVCDADGGEDKFQVGLLDLKSNYIGFWYMSIEDIIQDIEKCGCINLKHDHVKVKQIISKDELVLSINK